MHDCHFSYTTKLKKKKTLIGSQGQDVKLPKLKVEIFNRKMPGF
jgi:hypothetical protein